MPENIRFENGFHPVTSPILLKIVFSCNKKIDLFNNFDSTMGLNPLLHQKSIVSEQV